MTRTVTIGVLSALLILVLAFGGNALAQTGDANQGPLNAILKALGLIQRQTATIADAVAGTTSGLKVVDADLRAVGQAVAGGQQIQSQILQEVLGLHLQIDKLQASQRPAPSAHRLWVSPFWPKYSHLVDMFALNPGDIEADVSCLFLDRTGAVFQDRGPFIVQPGETHECHYQSDGFTRGAGWLIVTSDRPVLPYGIYYRSPSGDDLDLDLQFYPIDCTNPYDDTVSFACRSAKPAR